MRIQIASDLHLEFFANKEYLEKNPLDIVGDVLVLAGDIVSSKYRHQADDFYNYAQKNFKHVIEIPGNHEFYGSSIDWAYPAFMNKIKNLTQSNNQAIIVDDVKFICSTLWTHIPRNEMQKIEQNMLDYVLIKRAHGDNRSISALLLNQYNKMSVEFIEQELAKEYSGKTVVVTHHLPSYSCIPAKYRGNPLNSAFANKLDDLIKKNSQIKLWIHGHTHDFGEVKIGNTLVVRNPLGYVDHNEQDGFKIDYVIDV